ncbi:hypothetical protein GCM10027614_07040 [Micromonospora vulcania]
MGAVPATGGLSLVYFAGRTEDTIVGLGGSTFHVIGASPPPEPAAYGFASSTMPALLAGLVDPDDADSDPRVAQLPEAADAEALASVHQAGTRLRGPAQNVEFLAKRLLSGPSPYPELDGRPGMSVLLGSPLYVALVD